VSKRRYSAAKRAREINKQQERARKLARKHAKRSQRASADAASESAALDAEGQPLTGQSPDTAVAPADAPADVTGGSETNREA
jgi:hypothetical protein